MRYLTNVYWCRGREAEKNQDSVVLQQVLTRRGRVLLAAVCDGMGGASCGEEASGYAALRLREWFYTELFAMIRKNKRYWVIRRSLDRLVFQMQGELRQYAAQEGISLGTTMTVLVVWEKTWLLWHLGDSRAYRLRGRRMEQLTEDHAQDAGKLTKCLGSFGCFVPQHRMGVLKPGEGILLCTDGFRRCVTGEELQEVMAPREIAGEEQIGRRLKEIGETCMKRGEKDNLSAVYVRAAISALI
ncbi:MAG: protein phosphatase 2C domain-containing protein [Lachnospiraceae bacterium]|nr:protein phosphatase 2C domain-containing protein [Lachnospiraceae bacterium]